MAPMAMTCRDEADLFFMRLTCEQKFSMDLLRGLVNFSNSKLREIKARYAAFNADFSRVTIELRNMKGKFSKPFAEGWAIVLDGHRTALEGMRQAVKDRMQEIDVEVLAPLFTKIPHQGIRWNGGFIYEPITLDQTRSALADYLKGLANVVGTADKMIRHVENYHKR